MAIDINISTTFLGDTDTPNSYSGQANKVVSVKVDETGLEFTTISTSDTNIYNTNGTLTANRTVTHNGNTLRFSGKTEIKAFSAASSDIAFSVRNFGDTSDLMQIKGNGDPVFNAPNGVEMSYIRANFWNTRNDAVNIFTYNQNGFGEIYSPLRSVFDREMEVVLRTATTANFRIKNINNTLICFNVTENGKVSMPLLPTSATGLSAGDIWNDAGTLKIKL